MGQAPTPPTVRAIVGGNVATTCQWPTAVIVEPIGCSGTLVHRRAVVTAKHCLVDEMGNPDPPTSIGIGDKVSKFEKTVAIAKCYGHPTNDFAICTLAEDVTGMPIVPVMAACEMTLLEKGSAIVEAGFGATTAGNNATYGTKKWIAGTLTSNAANTVDISVTAGTQDGEYYGDSGGPLYFHMPDTTWRLIGEDCCSEDIVSASTAPRVSTYTSVPFHVAWAEHETGLDLTPCHDSGGWVGGQECTGFPTDPDRSVGSWSSMCQGQNLLLAATCDVSIYDASADGADRTVIDAIPRTEDTTADPSLVDGHDFDGASPTSDGASTDETIDPDSSVDSSIRTDDGGSSNVGGTGTAPASGGAGGSGGTIEGTGGTTRAPGTGGWAMGGTLGSAGGSVSSSGGSTALGGNATGGGRTTEDGGSKGHASQSSGCSCRLQNAGPANMTPGLLLVVGLLSGARLRRRWG